MNQSRCCRLRLFVLIISLIVPAHIQAQLGAISCNVTTVLNVVEALTPCVDNIEVKVCEILEKVCNLEPEILAAISISQAVICSKLDELDASSSCDLAPVLDAISESQAVLCSKIDDINVSVADVNLDPVLDAISASDELLCSKIDAIPFGATSIDVNVDGLTASCDLSPVLDAISASDELLCSKIDAIPFGATSIDVNVDGLTASCDLSPVLDAISASDELLCSKIDAIPFGATSIDVNVDGLTASCDLSPVLDAISASDELLCSKIDAIPFGATSIDVNVDGLTASCDLSPVLDAISASDELLCSKIDAIPFGATSIDVNVDGLTASCDLSPVLDAISASDELLCSKIDAIPFGATSIDVNVDGLTASCDLSPVLDAISASDELLCSKIDAIPFGATSIDVNVDGLTASCDLSPVLDAISASDELLCSKIDAIPFGATSIDVNVTGMDDGFTSVLDAISASDELLCSKIDAIPFGATSIDVNVTGMDDGFTSVLDAISASDELLCSKIDAIPFGATSIDVNVTGMDDGFTSVLDAISESDELLCSKIDAIPFGATSIDVNVTGMDDGFTSVLDAISESDELLCSKLEVIESKVDELGGCATTAINAPTTITAEGSYCVGEPIMGTIEIAASNVTLDLNGYRVSSGVPITGSQTNVTVFGGFVGGGSDAIDVASGSSNITLKDLVIEDGTPMGIHFTGVTGGLISNCSMSQNVTGIELDNSVKIVIENCTARCNTNAGFCLLSSTTCCLRDCKALSTGEGNVQTQNAVITGFVATDGYGNLFERCIANSTQGLSVADFDSLVAGFALRGSEGCSKIIGCESSNAQVDANGVTVPYGIVLEGSVNESLPALSGDISPSLSTGQTAVDWSPDGRYLTVTSNQPNQAIRVYQFDDSPTDNNILTLVDLDSTVTSGVDAARWSPNGMFVATASDDTNLRVYEFCTKTNQLTLAASFFVGIDLDSVAWSPDSNFIATGDSADDLRVFFFDQVKSKLVLQDVDAPIGSGDVRTLAWRPDGRFIATGSDDDTLRIYEFSAGTLGTPVTDGSASGDLRGVDWSPDGNFIATVSNDNTLRIYSFDASSGTGVLSSVLASFDIGADPGLGGLHWSPDGSYLAVSTEDSPNAVLILEWDRNSTITQRASTTSFTGNPANVRWSPDGRYIATAVNGTTPIVILESISFPQNNVVTDNVVYCNSAGGSIPRGIGISGSSIANMITRNTAYANPLNANVVNTNYAFVSNVFNQLFGQAPSDVQNISLDGQAIATPQDLALLAKQIKYKVCDTIPSQLDVIESKIDAIQFSTVDSPCAPTAITQSTNISVEGIYCVANPITDGAITISGSDIQLDLNGHRIEDGIIITGAANQIAIKNGTVENQTAGGAAILANAGATNIAVDGVVVRGSQIGIDFNGVVGGRILNCEMTQNTTGLELDNSAKITIDTCIASCNTNAGFCLLSSTTCCLTNCKALSTGEGNTQTENAVIAGFVSTDGFGNIFERCIANSTQALSTTDSNSLIAGFALRGSEQCTKIIECESANAQTDHAGFTVPYGILLEAQFDGLTSVTSINPGGGGTIAEISWSPDGQYLAVGGDTSGSDDLFVYRFDRVSESLTQVDSVSPGGASDTVSAVSWSPDGQYLAVGGDISGSDDLFVYRFDRVSENLTQVDSVNPRDTDDAINGVSWSPDGRYLAVGGTIDDVLGGDDLFVYRFDRVSENLTEVEAVSPGGGADIFAVSWSPDGRYLAAGGTINALGSNDLFVYRFDRAAESLTQVDDVIGMAGGFIFAVSWSPDGQYLAVGEFQSGNDFFVYRFDRATESLTQVEAVSPGGAADAIFAVSWSPDGQYLALGETFLGSDLFVYRFDRAAESLTEVDSFIPGGTSANITAVSWSPDGGYLAVGGDITGNDLFVYEALSFPSKNVIKDNTVYCNSGSSCPSGVGISGSSIANMIIGNTAYSNPVPRGINAPIVSSNYQFVTNIFNQLFGQGPTDLQNISLDGCDPICSPQDLALLAKQIKYKVCDTIPSQLDVIESKIDAIQFSTVDSPCAPTAITQSTNISVEGIYCVANPITNGAITISGSDIQLDLNGHRIEDGIIITGAANQIAIKNGTVENQTAGGAAILANAGATNIAVDGVVVRGSQIGIDFNGVVGGRILNCEMTQNTTGLELDNSAKITIDTCIASCNTNAGFCLLSSTTCCLKDCKALSTGEGNTQTENAVIAGFVSTDGFGNIFERCIANSTQALSTTDSNSLIAGFALRGSEQCTKIIECESANAQTDVAGLAVPYGIVLEATFDQLVSVTQVNVGGGADDSVTAVDWSPDGKYIAVGGNLTGDDVVVYQFNRVTQHASKVASASIPITGANVQSVDWSPDGTYLAVGGEFVGDDLIIYEFDASRCILTQVTSLSPAASDDVVRTVEWSPNGKYLAVGGTITGDKLYVYQFDRVTSTATLLASVAPGVVNPVVELSWSPDGNYIAAGGTITGTNDSLFVYGFNPNDETTSNRLVELVAVNPKGGTAGETVSAVKWSASGKYLAIGGTLIGGSNDDDVVIYEFAPLQSTASDRLVEIASASPGGTGSSDVIQALSWAPNGSYLAVGGQITDTFNEDLFVYGFDPGAAPSDRLTVLQRLNPEGGGVGDNVSNISWSPDGEYLALGGQLSGVDLIVYSALDFPSKNVIKDNTVYCNSGSSCPSGVGISGSSIANMIIGNTAYSNPVPESATRPFVSSNYQFVTNIFNQLFGQGPTDLQNISLDGCDPICSPQDLALIAKQIKYKVCDTIPSQLDVIESKVDAISFSTADVNLDSLCSKIGTLQDSGTCLDDMIANMPDDINNFQLNVIQLLKTILLELRGCCDAG